MVNSARGGLGKNVLIDLCPAKTVVLTSKASEVGPTSADISRCIQEAVKIWKKVERKKLGELDKAYSTLLERDQKLHKPVVAYLKRQLDNLKLAEKKSKIEWRYSGLSEDIKISNKTRELQKATVDLEWVLELELIETGGDPEGQRSKALKIFRKARDLAWVEGFYFGERRLNKLPIYSSDIVNLKDPWVFSPPGKTFATSSVTSTVSESKLQRSFRIDEEVWKKFEEVAKSLGFIRAAGGNRTKLINELICEYFDYREETFDSVGFRNTLLQYKAAERHKKAPKNSSLRRLIPNPIIVHRAERLTKMLPRFGEPVHSVGVEFYDTFKAEFYTLFRAMTTYPKERFSRITGIAWPPGLKVAVKKTRNPSPPSEEYDLAERILSREKLMNKRQKDSLGCGVVSSVEREELLAGRKKAFGG